MVGILNDNDRLTKVGQAKEKLALDREKVAVVNHIFIRLGLYL